MKYSITELQYRKIILNYLNEFVGDFVFENDEYEGDNWVDVHTSNGLEFGSVWGTTSTVITKGCNNELSLDEDFIYEFEETMPIVMPKIFSQVVLEYFNSKTGLECDCIELSYFTGEYDQFGDPLDQPYHYNANKQ
jgi:hypothetical protein